MVSVDSPIYDIWNFEWLETRLVGIKFTILELKRRGEAGAIAAWVMYAQVIREFIPLFFNSSKDPTETVWSDWFRVVGEDKLLDDIVTLHKKLHWLRRPSKINRYGQEELGDYYLDPKDTEQVRQLQESWFAEFQNLIGLRLPQNPNQLTKEQVTDSKNATRRLYGVEELPPSEKQAPPTKYEQAYSKKETKSGTEVKELVKTIEAEEAILLRMKEELRAKMERMKG